MPSFFQRLAIPNARVAGLRGGARRFPSQARRRPIQLGISTRIEACPSSVIFIAGSGGPEQPDAKD
jgi:hypothetical protein